METGGLRRMGDLSRGSASGMGSERDLLMFSMLVRESDSTDSLSSLWLSVLVIGRRGEMV